MLFTDSTFIGIDLASGRKLVTYAALDRDLNLVALASGEMDDVTAFISGQSLAAVAINAPAGVNRGMVRDMTKKKMLTSYQLRRVELRLSEHELRERGIVVTKTPSSVEFCPVWMQAGFNLYRKLEKMGFQKFTEKGATHQVMETNSHACYCLMVGHVPLARFSLEGRLQRQILLYEEGLRIRDPMDFFEEITRYKLIKGALPMDLLYLPEQLDALVAAHVAWLAVHRREDFFMLGDAKEGRMILPRKELKERYS
jgi:hypothetical protein